MRLALCELRIPHPVDLNPQPAGRPIKYRQNQKVVLIDKDVGIMHAKSFGKAHSGHAPQKE
jgi:hypothetical protein